ncbi:MAG: hypothetical protein ACKO5M_05200, partial [Vulcanococcus sp.]
MLQIGDHAQHRLIEQDVLGPGKMPLGMVYVPAQGYQSGGQDDQDIMGLHTARTKTVSIQAMYMDATEISNNEY